MEAVETHSQTIRIRSRRHSAGVSARPLLKAWVRQLSRVTVLVITDLFSLTAAALIGYFSWAWPVLHQGTAMYRPLLQALAYTPFGYAVFGLYPGIGLGPVEMLRRFSIATTIAALVFASNGFFFKLPAPHSRATFVIVAAAALALVPIIRFVTIKLACRWRWWRKPVVLVGHRAWARSTARAFRLTPSLGYRPVAAILVDAGETVTGMLDGALAISKASALSELGRSGECEAVLDGFTEDAALSKVLQDHFSKVTVIRELGDTLPIQGTSIEVLGDMLGLQFRDNLLLWQNRFFKRALDIAFGLLFGLLALPGIVIGALAVLLADGWPIFYRQDRHGMNGKKIKVWKLRTMRRNADQLLNRHLADNPSMAREWSESFKLRRDPRIIPYAGTFLRRHSIDELSQLLNVLIGQMSLVGPRPFPGYHLAGLSKECRKLRHRVRPGLTGLGQVTVRSDGDLTAQSHYDLYSVRNWSLWLNLYVMGSTAAVLVTGRGAS